jgi:signal transduction histidine kinase
VQTPPAAFLSKAFDELKSGNAPADRQKRLVDYVEAATTTVAERHKAWGQDLKAIVEQNRHIERILQDHTALSMGSRQLEPVDVAAAVSGATRLLPKGDKLAIEIELSPSLKAAPPILGNPVVVSQIIDNLIANAVDAIEATGRQSGRITIESSIDAINGRQMVHLVVRDDGAGISAEVLANLFERGFSTKKEQTGGLGLHWCANSVAALAGRMSAESAGQGAGAAFHVLLPVAPPAREAAE